MMLTFSCILHSIEGGHLTTTLWMHCTIAATLQAHCSVRLCQYHGNSSEKKNTIVEEMKAELMLGCRESPKFVFLGKDKTRPWSKASDDTVATPQKPSVSAVLSRWWTSRDKMSKDPPRQPILKTVTIRPLGGCLREVERQKDWRMEVWT